MKRLERTLTDEWAGQTEHQSTEALFKTNHRVLCLNFPVTFPDIGLYIEGRLKGLHDKTSLMSWLEKRAAV